MLLTRHEHVTGANRKIAALAALLVLMAATVLGAIPAAAAGGFFAGSVERAHDAETEMLDTINRLRTDVYGLAPLELREWGPYRAYLDCIVNENAANGRLAHYPASCQQGFVEAEILAARYASSSGGSVNTLVEQWNDSDGHRTIMLAADADYAYVGVYCIGHTSWAIAWIGTDSGSITPNNSPRQNRPDQFFTDNDYRCKDSAPDPVNDPLRVYDPADSIESLVGRPDFTTEQADVLRLYRAFFRRDAEIDGANYWLERHAKEATIGSIAYNFAASTEFLNTYGSVDNREFLEIVYFNVLDREADPDGFAYWLDKLETGALNRGEVVRWIAANDEFIDKHRYGGK